MSESTTGSSVSMRTTVDFNVQDETTIYQQYDRQRRLRLASGICLVFGILTAPFTVIVLLSLALNTGTANIAQYGGILSACLLSLALLTGTWFAAQQERLGLAVTLLLFDFIGGSAGVLLNQIFTSNTPHPGVNSTTLVGFIVLSSIIVVSGLLGGPWLIVTVTLLMNIFTEVIFLVFPLYVPTEASIRTLAPIFASTVPFYQWGTAALMIAGWRTYQRTIKDLGDARIARTRAEQLEALKNDFISNVNHELRNPIMTLQGLIELMRLTDSTNSPERRTALLVRADRSVNHLVALTESILDIRRLHEETDSFTPTAIMVSTQIEQAIQLIDHHKGERTLQVHVPETCTIWGEEIRVQQILINLLSNAVKYSPANTPITVVAEIVDRTITVKHEKDLWWRSTSKQTQRMAKITVRDYGLGIPLEQQPLLFNRLVRLPRDLASNVTGSGLGLFLCRKLAMAMGGDIEIHSTGIEGEGTSMVLYLPVPPKYGTQINMAADHPGVRVLSQQ